MTAANDKLAGIQPSPEGTTFDQFLSETRDGREVALEIQQLPVGYNDEGASLKVWHYDVQRRKGMTGYVSSNPIRFVFYPGIKGVELTRHEALTGPVPDMHYDETPGDYFDRVATDADRIRRLERELGFAAAGQADADDLLYEVSHAKSVNRPRGIAKLLSRMIDKRQS
jgi:hypothetical protein